MLCHIYIYNRRNRLHLLYYYSVYHKKSLSTLVISYGTQISAVKWRTVHEHVVADAFSSKKSLSALLVHEQQASLKGCLSSCHSTACGDCNTKIYENTGSECKTFEYWKIAYQMSLTFNSACCLHIAATTDVIVEHWKKPQGGVKLTPQLF